MKVLICEFLLYFLSALLSFFLQYQLLDAAIRFIGAFDNMIIRGEGMTTS